MKKGDGDTTIKVTQETRESLKLLTAQLRKRSYNETILYLIKVYKNSQRL